MKLKATPKILIVTACTSEIVTNFIQVLHKRINTDLWLQYNNTLQLILHTMDIVEWNILNCYMWVPSPGSVFIK